MKTIILLSLSCGICFLAFIATLFVGVLRKRKRLRIISLLFLAATAALGSLTAFTIARKSMNRLGTAFAPRSGIQIYEGLFDKPQTGCVRVHEHIDQIIPRLDNAIWLHFNTCPRRWRGYLPGIRIRRKPCRPDS